MKSYNDAYFDVLAAQGDPDYKTFYDRVKNNPSEAVYNTFVEGTRRIAEERAVLHAPDLMLFYHFVDNPQVWRCSLEEGRSGKSFLACDVISGAQDANFCQGSGRSKRGHRD